MNDAPERRLEERRLQEDRFREPGTQERKLQERRLPKSGRPERETSPGPLKAMSPGVVDYLFRQLVAGNPAEDIQWGREGVALSAQPPGAELARRLSECDLEALTPTELFHYVRAAQRLASWAESLREDAVARYCGAPGPESAGREPAEPGPARGIDK